MSKELTQYTSLLGEIKTRIGQARTRAAFSANREMLALYSDEVGPQTLNSALPTIEEIERSLGPTSRRKK